MATAAAGLRPFIASSRARSGRVKILVREPGRARGALGRSFRREGANVAADAGRGRGAVVVVRTQSARDAVRVFRIMARFAVCARCGRIAVQIRQAGSAVRAGGCSTRRELPDGTRNTRRGRIKVVIHLAGHTCSALVEAHRAVCASTAAHAGGSASGTGRARTACHTRCGGVEVVVDGADCTRVAVLSARGEVVATFTDELVIGAIVTTEALSAQAQVDTSTVKALPTIGTRRAVALVGVAAGWAVVAALGARSAPRVLNHCDSAFTGAAMQPRRIRRMSGIQISPSPM